MEFSAEQLAGLLGGTVDGDGKVTVGDYAKIEEGKPGTISFLSNPKYEHYIYSTKASIVLVNNDFKPSRKVEATLIRVPDAYMALAKLMKLAERKAEINEGVSELAFVSPGAKLAEDVSVAPFAYIGDNVSVGRGSKIFPGAYLGADVSVGEDCIIYPNASVYRGCKIGNRCILHSSCVIGADGFGFAKNEKGDYVKMPQNGNVVIGNGVKIDNQVQVAHNVELGESTAVAACSGIAGSTKIGKHCVLAGKVGVVGHAHIADNCILAAGTNLQSGIDKPGSVYQGSPALPFFNAKRSFAAYKNLPDMVRTVNSMQKEIEKLKQEIQSIKETQA